MVRWLALAWLFIASPVLAQTDTSERITSFDSVVEVGADGTLTVTETITVYAAGQDIRRGIFRDFPLFRGQRGVDRMMVSFSVQDVTRNGVSELWRREGIDGGIRIYIGNPNIFIPAGQHTYVIRYQSDRQIGFFDDHDELYWNITGNAWQFPIEKASATIVLPSGATVEQTEAFVGAVGERGADYSIERLKPNKIRVEATRPLGLYEGLTVVVGWPPGFVDRSSQESNNAMFYVALLCAIWIGRYYYTQWAKLGRDPEAGSVIAQYEPPENMSPAACRFVMNRGWDPTGFTAALLNMAVKGYLVIDDAGDESDEDDETYKIIRTAKPESTCGLSGGEKKLGETLFQDGDEFVFEQDNHRKIFEARTALKGHLQSDYSKEYFSHNRGTIAGGIWRSVVAFFVITFFAGTGWSMGLLASMFVLLVYLGLFVIHIPFYFWMKANTRLGQTVLNHIEGFRTYLTVAEKDRMNFENPPDLTPELFERYLPFALALDVGHEWSEQFNAALDRFINIPEKREMATTYRTSYRPNWYRGRRADWSSPKTISDSWAPALARSISTAATAPSSSSGFSSRSGGFSGGGFSGGGGGGGGGGGW